MESSQQLLLATHEGLFDVTDESIEKVSPTLDLMGFAEASADLYYASGHPGPGSELPNPLGLVKSTDGGETWQELSRQGESDFHTMTVSSEGIFGFDGTLRLTGDGEEWTEVEAPFQPANLSAYVDSPAVLATTEEGVQRSTDGGLTWELSADSPVLLLTTFADEATVAGVSPDGVIYTSQDAGQTWEEAGGTTAAPAALAATTEGENGLRVWVSTEKGIEYSEDGGASFTTTVRAGQ
nr:exo-alpha-sialidase [uncultured Arthrobacter sp.]